ncbi:MAG: SDR family NAD(P)-dependent oxidoreductase, partial [Flavitalea sp.]
GFNVAILDKVQPANNPVSDKWFYLSCDVSDSTAVSGSMDKIMEHFGSINYLVNNAGIQRYGSIENTSDDEWDLVMNVNLRSYFLCSKYVLPHMRKSVGGAIINISSVQAFVSQTNVVAYATAKTAILGLTRSMAIDLAPEIRCVAVCPGTIDTPLLKNALALSPDPEAVMQECIDMHLLKRLGNPKEIAALVKFLCSDAAGFITGEAIRIDGGLGIMIQGSKKD